MSKLDTNYIINLDLIKDRVNSVMKFCLVDVETSDFYLVLYNNGTRIFDKNYTVTLYVVKPNGNFKNIELEPKENLKKYYCNLPDTLKNIPGEYLCQAVIFDNSTGEKKISKSKFKYSVDLDLASEMAGIIDEEEQESILTDILNRLLTLENPVEPYATKKHVDECVSALTEEIDTIKVKDTEQDNRLTNIEGINTTQNNRLDAIEIKDIDHELRMTNIESKNTEQDNRLDVAENRLANIGNDITNTMQPIIDEHTSRLDAIEAIDVAQNNRLGAIEAKNKQQDDRLLDIEKINNRQDIDIKCLYGASQTMDVTKEGNSIYLQNSNNGFTIVDEIKGNTLVNCNKEPNKELILNGNINTSGDNNITITEGVDGGLVDVALEGNTLVNVSKTKDIIALPLEEELTYLYANTQYTVQFVSDKAVTIDITLGGTQLLAQSIVAGLNRISITTPATLVDNKLIIDGTGANISEVVVTDTNREFGYFEGMKSVGECESNEIEILSNNRNLLKLYDTQDTININGLTIKMLNRNEILINGTSNTSYTWVELLYNFKIGTDLQEEKVISLNQNVKYTLSSNIISGTVSNLNSISFSMQHKNIEAAVTCDGSNSFNITFDGSDGVYRLWFTVLGNVTFNNCIISLQLEKGGTKTPYVVNKSNKIKLLLNEPLRAVGDVKDRYVLIDGKWYIERNYNEALLDGNENWDRAQVRDLTTVFYTSSITGVKLDNVENYGLATPVLSPQFPYATHNLGAIGLDKEGIYIARDGNLCMSIAKAKLSSIEVSGFSQWLQQNPITIVYQLASPVYEPIDYNPLEVYSNITHITTNSTIPTKITVKNHGFNCLLKPSTTYTVSSNLGLNTVTTPTVLTEDCLRFYDTDTSDITTMKDVLVLEGDWTTKAELIPANFSGIESAFEQELVIDESDANYGKYKVNPKIANEDKSKENNITFYLNEPLRGVGDVKDRVYIKDDKIVVQRNCGSVTFDGSDDEVYITLDDNFNNVKWFGFNLNNKKLGRTHPSICDKFINLPLWIDMELIQDAVNLSAWNCNTFIAVSKTKLLSADVEGFKQWLQQNPTTVVYQLAEPTYEEVEYNDVKLFIESFKNSTLFYNSNIPVTSKLYYSYSVPIVDTVAQTANVTDQQDSMIIDMAVQVSVLEMMTL